MFIYTEQAHEEPNLPVKPSMDPQITSLIQTDLVTRTFLHTSIYNASSIQLRHSKHPRMLVKDIFTLGGAFLL